MLWFGAGSWPVFCTGIWGQKLSLNWLSILRPQTPRARGGSLLKTRLADQCSTSALNSVLRNIDSHSLCVPARVNGIVLRLTRQSQLAVVSLFPLLIALSEDRWAPAWWGGVGASPLPCLWDARHSVVLAEEAALLIVKGSFPAQLFAGQNLGYT